MTRPCLPQFTNHVIRTDTDQDKVDALNRGRDPIFELGVEGRVQQNHAGGPGREHRGSPLNRSLYVRCTRFSSARKRLRSTLRSSRPRAVARIRPHFRIN